MFLLAKIIIGTFVYTLLRLLYGKYFALWYIQDFIEEKIFSTKVFVYIRRHAIALLLSLTIASNTR